MCSQDQWVEAILNTGEIFIEGTSTVQSKGEEIVPKESKMGWAPRVVPFFFL